MTRLTIEPGAPLRGEIHPPGDKSISHRAALFAALARGESRVENFLDSGVTRAMLNCLSALGVDWHLQHTSLMVRGAAWQTPASPLECGNSATTLRLLAGGLAAAGVAAVLDGSPGLRRRPMDRIVQPLRQIGAPIRASDGGHAPLVLDARPAGKCLNGGVLRLDVASAQVKSCLLLAGLACDSPLTVIEPHCSRDHSERMLAAMGVGMSTERMEAGWAVTLTPPHLSRSQGSGVTPPHLSRSQGSGVTPPAGDLRPLNLRIPGDFSAASFWIVAALITPGSRLAIRGVGLNPGRTGLLESLLEMGARIEVQPRGEQGGEPLGDLWVEHSPLRGIEISGERVTAMIDEFPVFSIAAAFAEGVTKVRDALELRYKESDRIASLCRLLAALGGQAEAQPQGFIVHGRGGLAGGAVFDPGGDHRMAMAAAVAGMAARQAVTIQAAEIIRESYPDFVQVLVDLGGQATEKEMSPAA
ncbi:MAG: 3-phosphoshikimate 1-carboxyvinyltransferase [Chloroflexota bacterium]